MDADRSAGPDGAPPSRRSRPTTLRRGAHSPSRRPARGTRRRSTPTAPSEPRSRRPTATLAPLAALAAVAVVLGAAATPVLAYRSEIRHQVVGVTPRSTDHSTRPRTTAPAGAGTTSAARCPLTGLPAPGGVVPARPALAVKVDNYPNARPQSALDQADVVFEEPVEGGVTRLVAVYQCQAPPLIGPVRSAREPDVAIADELSDPVFVHAGGIQPILAMLEAANLDNIDVVFSYSSSVLQPPGRYPPYDTYVAADTMWQLAGKRETSPAPLFSYDATTDPGGKPVASVHIPFSSYSDATWTWSASDANWQLSYSGVPATTYRGATLTGTQEPIAVANVVIETVHTFTGPWVENSLGAHEVEVVATGSGPATVLRDGRAISGRWYRKSLRSAPRLRDAAGHTIDLTPGETWVELVPSTVPVTTEPPTTAGSTGSAGTTG